MRNHTMPSNWTIRGARVALALSLLALITVADASAKPGPAPGKKPRRGFNLMAAAEVLMEVNRASCNLNNLGQVCTAEAGSSTGESGVWPKGTPDTYIFNSGLQVAAIIPPD